jgi:amino acid permease
MRVIGITGEQMDSPAKSPTEKTADVDVASGEFQGVSFKNEQLARKLGGKEVQLFAIGGAIGTSQSSVCAHTILS